MHLEVGLRVQEQEFLHEEQARKVRYCVLLIGEQMGKDLGLERVSLTGSDKVPAEDPPSGQIWYSKYPDLEMFLCKSKVDGRI